MKKYILIESIVIIAIIAGYFVYQEYNTDKPEQTKKPSASENCKIENPDPEDYLIKICNYLEKNKDTIDITPADPKKYKIKSIKEGKYSTTDAIIVSLDCCYMGDIAYFDKDTKEIIGFQVGNW